MPDNLNIVAENLAVNTNCSKEQKEELVSELESLGVKVIITGDQLSLLDDSFDYCWNEHIFTSSK